MADKLMQIPNDDKQNTPSVDYNYWLKRLNTLLNVSINQIFTKVPKVVRPTNNEALF